MSSNARPIYVLIDCTPEPGSNRVDRTGRFDSLLLANKFIPPRGPPLPIVVQCMPDQENDLDQLKTLVKGVRGGNSVVEAATYIKTVIPLIETLVLWPENPKFYACVGGRDAKKLVTQQWGYMSQATSGDTIITPAFSTFIHAFIYALAGGDAKLKEMELYDRWGWNKAPFAGGLAANDTLIQSTPSSQPAGPSTSSSQQPVPEQQQLPSGSRTTVAGAFGSTPSTPSTPMQSPTLNKPLTPKPAFTPYMPKTPSKTFDEGSSRVNDIPRPVSAEGPSGFFQSNSRESEWPASPLQSKGKQRATPLIVGKRASLMPAGQRGAFLESTTPRSAGKQRVPTPSPSSNTQPHRFCEPASLIPISLLSNPRLTLRSLPVVFKRTPTGSGDGHIVEWQDLDVDDHSLLLPANTTLPPFVEYGVRALGWGPDMLKVVEVSWSSEGSRNAFILTLAESGMPMAEAYFIWELIQREAGGQ